MVLSSMSAEALTQFGLSLDEAEQVKELLGTMMEVNDQSADWFAGQNPHNWVLKNQGEGRRPLCV